MKIVSIFQYALKAYKDGRYESIESLSKAQHCFHLVEISRNLAKQIKIEKNNKQRRVN